ncbi:MAG: hypothetical protein KME20_15800 [Kaiparowitsia implicata GSE-PSE-MK54-09C]|jgi:hypothetical protein|nr:hypothetical protein [Kaiparowitsia implicata GSE-PSE-MK54-09C]
MPNAGDAELNSTDLKAALDSCLALARDPRTQADARERFADLLNQLPWGDRPSRQIIDALWQEVITARRSAAFWEQISDVERNMTEQLAENHVQLQQNYLRLVQEQ